MFKFFLFLSNIIPSGGLKNDIIDLPLFLITFYFEQYHMKPVRLNTE